jgi:hypothetical protein
LLHAARLLCPWLIFDVRQNMKRVPPAVVFRKPPKAALSRLGDIAAFFREEDGDFVFRSGLGDGHSVSAHLVWLNGMLQHHGKVLRTLREEGLDLIVRVKADGRELVLEPNALLLAHKLGIPTEVSFR